MTAFDFIAVTILIVSALVGFVRGGTREVITVVAFILSILVAILALRFTGPMFRHGIHPVWLANAVALLVVFVVAYILIRVLGASLTRTIHSTEALGTLDRLVGVGFGVVRALVLLGVFFLVFNAATPPERVPGWIKDADTYPLAAFSANMLQSLAPGGSAVADRVGPALESAVKSGAAEPPRAPASGTGRGYDSSSRQTIDQLVEKSR